MCEGKYLQLLKMRMKIADIRGRGTYQGWANNNEAIFIHIPKTAGTSVSGALGISNARHLSWHEYYDTNSTKFHKFFKFAIVRNPWDRLVSAYHYLNHGGNSSADLIFKSEYLCKYKTFEEFATNGLLIDEIKDWVHFRPQISFVADSEYNFMIDNIYHYENITNDIYEIGRKLNIRIAALDKVNASNRGNYRKYYTPVTAELVANIYADDIKAFNYSF